MITFSIVPYMPQICILHFQWSHKVYHNFSFPKYRSLPFRTYAQWAILVISADWFACVCVGVS